MSKPISANEVARLAEIMAAGYPGPQVLKPTTFEIVVGEHKFPVVADPNMPKGMFMFGGLPFNYDAGDDDDDGDVADVEKLKAQIEQQQKTIDRLVKLQTIHPEKTIFVLKIPNSEGWSQENHDAFTKNLPKGSVLIAMPEGYELDGLDDQDLHAIGLRRGTGPAMTEKEQYDAMLMGYRTK